MCFIEYTHGLGYAAIHIADTITMHFHFVLIINWIIMDTSSVERSQRRVQLVSNICSLLFFIFKQNTHFTLMNKESPRYEYIISDVRDLHQLCIPQYM